MSGLSRQPISGEARCPSCGHPHSLEQMEIIGRGRSRRFGCTACCDITPDEAERFTSWCRKVLGKTP